MIHKYETIPVLSDIGKEVLLEKVPVHMFWYTVDMLNADGVHDLPATARIIYA